MSDLDWRPSLAGLPATEHGCCALCQVEDLSTVAMAFALIAGSMKRWRFSKISHFWAILHSYDEEVYGSTRWE